jgi:hypothetical protein
VGKGGDLGRDVGGEASEKDVAKFVTPCYSVVVQG